MSSKDGVDQYYQVLQERKRKDKDQKERNLKMMQEARTGGKSALDCMDDDDDDGDVYDMVDEEEYAKIVETRRKESDFVVDDNGIGYADHGEEVVGVIEDAHDAKRRMKEAAEEGDSKGAKRARKLAEASAAFGQAPGQRSMNSFVRTGQSTVQRVSAAKDPSKQTNLLDIDALMGGGGGGGMSGSSQHRHTGILPFLLHSNTNISYIYQMHLLSSQFLTLPSYCHSIICSHLLSFVIICCHLYPRWSSPCPRAASHGCPSPGNAARSRYGYGQSLQPIRIVTIR